MKTINTIKDYLLRLDIMKRSLLISLLLHFVLLLIIQRTFPLAFLRQEFRTYEVELIRDPVLDMSSGLIMEEVITRLIEEKKLDTTPAEETISLDTKDERFISYTNLLKQRIGAEWKYPALALESLLEGKLTLLFSLNRNGRLFSIKIVESSGYTVLDGEASRAVQAAAPYPPFPDQITSEKLNIIASFDYRLTSPQRKHDQKK